MRKTENYSKCAARALAICQLTLLSPMLNASTLRLDELPPPAIRVRAKQLNEQPVTDNVKFTLAFGRDEAVQFAGSAWSQWLTASTATVGRALGGYPNSYNRRPQLKLVCNVQPVGIALTNLWLDVETRLEGGEMSLSPAELIGPSLGVLVWRDGTAGPLHIDTLAGHGRRVLAPAMDAAALPPAERPQQIIFGERYIGGDSDALCQREGIARLCGLGFNAMHAVPRPLVRYVRAGGIKRLWGAVYTPPGYAWNFATNRHDVFRDFVNKQISGALRDGWQREEIAFWVTSDEPGWYYPETYTKLNEDPLAMADFQQYLRAQGLRPRDVGLARWSDLRLIGRRDYRSLPQRRLFYWSNRFVPWASSRFFAEVTRAFEEEMGAGFPVLVNFNNFMGRFYQPGAVGNNRAKNDGNAAMGQHDWLEFGRMRGSTCIATEDWFGDGQAAQWSFYATRLRSAADYAGTGFGSLVIPRTSGQRPAGMAQKLLALIGQGAKNIQFFTFGPEYNFPGNCYDYNTAVYAALAHGMGIVGRAEELLYPGKLWSPQIAIMMPQSGQLWDLEEQEVARGVMDVTNNDMFRNHIAYMAETCGLHLVLQHAALTAQAIDEEGCAGGDLQRYKVLFLTAPEVPVEAAQNVLRWVKRGGTLVLTAGSALFDRYHQPQAGVRAAAGGTPAQTLRPVLKNLGAWSANGTISYGARQTTHFGERELLPTRHATVEATFDDGTPLLLSRKHGKGVIYTFAAFPGVNYRRSAEGNRGGLPAGFAALWRDLILLPVRQAAVVAPVTVATPLIEAPALYSERGVAVTLLNWHGEPQRAVTVTVRTVKPVARAVSALKGALQFATEPARVGEFAYCTTLTFDLGDVDVVSLFYDE